MILTHFHNLNLSNKALTPSWRAIATDLFCKKENWSIKQLFDLTGADGINPWLFRFFYMVNLCFKCTLDSDEEGFSHFKCKRQGYGIKLSWKHRPSFENQIEVCLSALCSKTNQEIPIKARIVVDKVGPWYVPPIRRHPEMVLKNFEGPNLEALQRLCRVLCGKNVQLPKSKSLRTTEKTGSRIIFSVQTPGRFSRSLEPLGGLWVFKRNSRTCKVLRDTSLHPHLLWVPK